MTKRPFSKPVYGNEERSGLPSVNQNLFKAEPGDSHAVCMLWVYPPSHPVPPFLLAQNLGPKDVAISGITSWKLYYASIAYNWLISINACMHWATLNL